MSLYLFISASFMIHFCLLAQNKYGQCPLDTYIVPFPTFPSSWWFWNPWKVWQTCISERFTNMATTDRRAGKTNHSDCTSSTIVADYKQRSAQTPHWQGRYIQVLLNRKGIWSTWTSRPTNRSCPCKPTLSHGAPAVGTSSCPSPPAAFLIRLKKRIEDRLIDITWSWVRPGTHSLKNSQLGGSARLQKVCLSLNVSKGFSRKVTMAM